VRRLPGGVCVLAAGRGSVNLIRRWGTLRRASDLGGTSVNVVSASESNKKLIRDYVLALSEQNYGRARELSDSGWIEHVPGAPPRGLEMLQAGERWFAAFSDWKHTIVDQIAEGDKVVTWVRWSGRHTGEFAGVSATGAETTFDVFRLDRVAGDKLVETRYMYDLQDFLSRLRR
jgi:predicted ester cyclase